VLRLRYATPVANSLGINPHLYKNPILCVVSEPNTIPNRLTAIWIRNTKDTRHMTVMVRMGRPRLRRGESEKGIT
jgi:hypothetical protein